MNTFFSNLMGGTKVASCMAVAAVALIGSHPAFAAQLQPFKCGDASFEVELSHDSPRFLINSQKTISVKTKSGTVGYRINQLPENCVLKGHSPLIICWEGETDNVFVRMKFKPDPGSAELVTIDVPLSRFSIDTPDRGSNFREAKGDRFRLWHDKLKGEPNLKELTVFAQKNAQIKLGRVDINTNEKISSYDLNTDDGGCEAAK